MNNVLFIKFQRKVFQKIRNCHFLINIIDWSLPNELLLPRFPLHQHNYKNSNYHL